MHVEVGAAREFPFAEVAMEWFLPGVNPYVGLHVSLCEESLFTNLTVKGSHLAVDHLEVLGEAEGVDEAFPALGADVDPAVAVHPVVPFQRLGVVEELPAELARKRPAAGVEADVVLEGRDGVEDPAAFPALVLEQAAADDRQRLQRRYHGRRSDGYRVEGRRRGVHEFLTGGLCLLSRLSVASG